jgi:hypothetical protein
MSVNRLYIGNDTDLIVQPFVDASHGLPITDAELFVTICHAERTGLIVGASNASPIVITTQAAHGLVTGDVVCLVGVGGNTAARGTFTVTVLTTTTFSLDSSAGNGDWTRGGRWYQAVDDPDGQEIPLLLDGSRYLGVVPGEIGLVEGGRYAVIFYATGEYRDRYSQVDQASASLRSGSAN